MKDSTICSSSELPKSSYTAVSAAGAPSQSAGVTTPGPTPSHCCCSPVACQGDQAGGGKRVAVLSALQIGVAGAAMALRLGAGAQADAQRFLLRSLELLHSEAPESEDSLLAMLRKTKKESVSSTVRQSSPLLSTPTPGKGGNGQGAAGRSAASPRSSLDGAPGRGPPVGSSTVAAAQRGRPGPPLPAAPAKKKSKLDAFRSPAK
mmetsp:Transcript_24445/g.67958  ORF Transcript_24445/g.67958 Transcript_24445/m.67958 type:complete len:205 (+) Transcript_24445:24-638(+)